jgi:hypothetical protein
MKWGESISALWRGIILAIAIVALGPFTSSNARAKDVMLLLEQSPINGGAISPVPGMYHFEPDSRVTLTAVPKPGYRFLHWLGDVSDPSATKTVVHLNKSKIVVAVFEQNDYRLGKPEGLPTGGGGGSGPFPTPADLSWPGGFSASGGNTRIQPITYVIRDSEPVPEPATGVILLLGGILTLRRRTGKKR